MKTSVFSRFFICNNFKWKFLKRARKNFFEIYQPIISLTEFFQPISLDLKCCLYESYKKSMINMVAGTTCVMLLISLFHINRADFMDYADEVKEGEKQ